MKREQEIVVWIAVSAAAFSIAVCLVIGMVIAIHYGALKGEETQFVRFVIAIALGASTSTLTVGALRARAAITGKRLGLQVDLGGAAAVLSLTVFGAFYFTSDRSFEQGFYLKNSKTGRPVPSESMTLILQLQSGPRSAEVGPSGFLVFKDLPAALRNSRQKLLSGGPAYVLSDSAKDVILDGKAKTIEVTANDPPMWTFRRKVNYELIKLLVPLRIMAGDSFGEHAEVPVSAYLRPEVVQKLVTTPLKHDPGNLSLDRFKKMFTYLPTEPFWRKELLDARGTYGERLARSSMSFVEFYQNMSQLERSYLSEKEVSLIHAVRSTLQIERMKNLVGMELSDDETLIKEELRDFLEKLAYAEKEMGPFEMHFVTF